MTDLVQEMATQEVQRYQKSYNILRRTDVDDLLSFSLQSALTEYRTEMPTLMSIIENSILKSGAGKMKDINFGLASCVSKLVALNSNQLSAYRYVFSNLLMASGAKAVSHDILAKTFDAMRYTSVLEQQNIMASNYIEKVKTWQLVGQNYSIVFDNLDKHTKAHKGHTNRSQNQMHHMVHAIAYESRVSPPEGLSAEPEIAINHILPSDLLPNHEDYTSLRHELATHIRGIVADNIPALAWMKPVSSAFHHLHSHELSRETKQVSN